MKKGKKIIVYSLKGSQGKTTLAAALALELDWQIITNDEHSTVWDGKYTFFDMNYLALKVPVQYCAEATLLNPDSKFLSAGKYLHCY